MRNIILILFLFFTLQVNAATYYVSATGNDSSGGTTTATAWQTLAKVNATTFVFGDQILFQKGDTFYGSLTVVNEGVTFGAYGTGVDPIITGFTSITSWTNLGGNIWESTAAVSTLSTCNMVVINGVNVPMGRYPNSGYLTFQSHSANTSITSSSLTGTPNWTGAEAVIRVNQFLLDRTNITSQSGGTLNYSPALTDVPTNGFGFFIQNDVRTLDTQNEWYYNPSTKKLSIYSTSTPTNVQVPTIDNLVTMQSKTHTFDHISFLGANNYSFYNVTGGMWDVTIQNCTIKYSGIDGIYFTNSTRFILDNCTVSNSNNNGVGLTTYNPTTTIKNSTIENSGIHAGMGKNGFGSYMGILFNGDNSLVQNNRVINTGFDGILFYGSTITVINNFVDTFCSVKQDGGGIYFAGNLRTITGNIVLNGVGAIAGTNDSNSQAEGIYADDNASNFEISGNTVIACTGLGLYLHNTNNFNVHDNTFFDNGIQFATVHNATGGSITSGIIINNKFISKTATQRVGYFYSSAEDIAAWGTVNNNYYARPIDDNLIIDRDNGSTVTRYDLAGWQTYSGHDSNSHKSPYVITSESEIQLVYNSSATAQPISLTGAWKDLPGTVYYPSITLQAFAAKVLFSTDITVTPRKKGISAGNGKTWKNPITGVPYGL